MLVLSRRIKETIRFPQLGISVSIVSVKGNRVQIGVEAPSDIQILRKELEPSSDGSSGNTDQVSTALGPLPRMGVLSREERHAFQNRLNRATLGLHLAQKQLAAGQIEQANKTLASALDKLAELDRSTSVGGVTSSEATDRRAVSAAHASMPRDQKSRDEECSLDANAIDVLLVEDDPNEQALLRTVLEMEGYRVHTASNGHEAIQQLENSNPQIVLLDMLMPECDGYETLKNLRSMPSYQRLPVFAVSGTSPEAAGLSIGEGGVDDWFPKPLNAASLVKHMRERTASLCP
jgi:carbon storage regulator CsrA